MQNLKRDYESKPNTWKFKKELSENEYENYLSNLKIQRKTKQSRSFSFQRSKWTHG